MGKIITVSGIDGSGKTTCIEMIKNILNSESINNVIVVDAMKDGIFMDRILNVLNNRKTYLRQCFPSDFINLVWTLDLIYIYEKYVKDLLSKGFNVIMHRSELCCRVYSKLYSNNDVIDNILDKFNFNYDIKIFLDIEPQLAYSRISNRASYITEKENIDMLVKARNLYDSYLNNVSYKDVKIIDASENVEVIFEQLKRIILDEYNK